MHRITKPRTAIFAFLSGIADLDAAYREARTLAAASDEQLRDMGITREEADAPSFRLHVLRRRRSAASVNADRAFFRALGEARWTPRMM